MQEELFQNSVLFGPLPQVIRKQYTFAHCVINEKDVGMRVFPNSSYNDNILKVYASRFDTSVDKLYQVCGIICARIIVDHLLFNLDHQMPVTLCHSLMKQVLGLPVSFVDFQYDDQELFDSRVKYVAENNPDDLELTFTDTIIDFEGKAFAEVQLLPDSPDLRVTHSNKAVYLKRFAQHRLRENAEKHIQSFIHGFRTIIPDEIISVFNPFELTILCCFSRDVSVEEMKQYTDVTGFAPGTKEVKWFWTAVESLTSVEKKKLLQFITGSSAVPPNGLQSLKPKLNIVKSSAEKDSLPNSHTCFNRMDLPSYSSYATLQKMLIMAVNEGYKGFGLV